MGTSKIRKGSRVEFQNMVGVVVDSEGPNAWLIKVNGSNSKITVPEDKLTLIMNEGHTTSSRMEDYRQMLNS